MIIDTVEKEGVPYRCEKCGALFVWRPDKEQIGECSKYIDKRKCKEINCVFYETYESEQCPICGNRYNYRISATKYKLLRAFRRLWDD